MPHVRCQVNDCDGLTLAGNQMPTELLLLPSFTEQERENRMKRLEEFKVRTVIGRDRKKKRACAGGVFLTIEAITRVKHVA